MKSKQLNAKFEGKKTAILGFGVESQETVEFLLKHGARITVFDEKDESAFDAARLAHLRGERVGFHFGEFPSLTDFDCIVRSPGVRPGIAALHEAGDLGIEITSATNIFLENSKGTVVGVTGTKGKGTTAALLYEMTKTAGRDVYLGGNIGIPALSFLEKLSDDSISILELSSFQLMDATQSPRIAIVLMTTQDHLDYHTSLDEYVMAKMGISRNQSTKDSIIVNTDYPASIRIADRSEARRFEVSRYRRVSNGCYTDNGQVILVKDGTETQIIEMNRIRLVGKHNLENVCAAVMAAQLLDIPLERIREALETFPGLPHRLELVRELDGVQYYNDSIATTPEATIAAIKAFDDPKVLILGGSGKGSDFTELGRVISEDPTVKTTIGIGQEWPTIKLKVKSEKLKVIEGLQSMRDIVQKARELAAAGDVVILSPACASFDMFKDYKDRGDQFKKNVNQL